MVTFAP